MRNPFRYFKTSPKITGLAVMRSSTWRRCVRALRVSYSERVGRQALSHRHYAELLSAALGFGVASPIAKCIDVPSRTAWLVGSMAAASGGVAVGNSAAMLRHFVPLSLTSFAAPIAGDTRFGMMSSAYRKIARLLAVLAVSLQAMLPGALAHAEAKGADVSRYICASGGQISPEMRAAVQLLADLAGDPTPAEDPSLGDCPLCTLVHGVPLPQPVAIPAPTALVQGVNLVRRGLAISGAVQGPPLGPRGPPTHI